MIGIDPYLVFVIVASEVIAIYLTISVIKSNGNFFAKAISILFLQIPVVGPVFFYWIKDMPDPMPRADQNDFARGTYTQRWIMRREGLRKKIEEKSEKESNQLSKKKKLRVKLKVKK